MEYYSLFWGHRVISTVNELQHLRIGHQHSHFWPILARYLNYNSVFGFKCDFHDLRTPWCVYVSDNDTHNFGQFLVRFVYYYSPFWRPRAISTIYNPRGAFASLSSKLTVLANSDAIRGLLLIIYGSRSDSIVVEP